ncbi:PREDICTED: serine/threonine-kinase [Prunus dulcis]|uniref:PREDICTED: serine/threonine-kinase n=2 Tax=Prunus dulcis TaxID=3755 RepID=A0A5E4GA08_PRUDU|nr:PREDICTED: serine/threonine-kinase [Prunus dulcis]
MTHPRVNIPITLYSLRHVSTSHFSEFTSQVLLRVLFSFFTLYRLFLFASHGGQRVYIISSKRRAHSLKTARNSVSGIAKAQVLASRFFSKRRSMGRMGANSRSHSANPSDYKLLEEVGYGASATVYRAIYLPFNEVVAVKCLDLDRCGSNFEDIRREAQTMSLIDHPNVVKAYCSFVVERNLWVIMPFMAEGSCLHLMKIAYPDGFEESAIGSILKETLKALVYLHKQGHIHRDVKAGNILLDTNGVVKLADFGVSACLFDAADRQRSRNTFVGTPCWMAPEVLQPGSGYNSKADIWSFGITALELAHGHAPFSKYPPMKVLLMTIQNAPPGLDYDRDKKFSKSFKEMVAMCLVKDQTKRPTAEKLLKHSFFKNAKPPELSIKKLFTDLPPLWNRVKALQLKDAAQLALKKMPSAEQEAISQSEYQRGVSAWNFDVEDLKAQASLVRDDDDIPEMMEEDEKLKSVVSYKEATGCQSSLGKLNENSEPYWTEYKEVNDYEAQQVESLNKKGKVLESNILESGGQQKTAWKKNESSSEATASTSEKDMVQAKNKNLSVKSRQTQSGPLTPGAVLSHSVSERARIFERSENENQPAIDKAKCEVRRTPSFSGPLMLPNRASANSLSAPIKSSGGFRDSLDDKSKANLVQIKGRFSVTSENLDLVKDIPSSTIPRRSSQGSPLRKSASVGDWVFESRQMPTTPSAKELNNSNIPASLLLPHLQNLFQQTSIQQDIIMNLLSTLQPAEAVEGTQNGKLPPLPRSSETNGSVEAAVSERERLLLLKVSELQARMNNLSDELTAEKMRHIQLQQQLNAVSGQEENGDGR